MHSSVMELKSTVHSLYDETLVEKPLRPSVPRIETLIATSYHLLKKAKPHLTSEQYASILTALDTAALYFNESREFVDPPALIAIDNLFTVIDQI